MLANKYNNAYLQKNINDLFKTNIFSNRILVFIY
jgi:hypothetical protein